MEDKASKAYRKRIKRRSRRRMISFIILCLIVVFFGKWAAGTITSAWQLHKLAETKVPDWVSVQIIPVDGDSRKGERLEGLKDIVIHYVGNPGTTAQENHDFYCNADSDVSSHFVIGLDGEIIQCIPLNERSSASNWRNSDTISIEVCHPDKTGKFTEKSHASLVRLTAWLCGEFNLNADHVIRHYDITGKKCPLYFVEHEDKWEQCKADIANAMNP